MSWLQKLIDLIYKDGEFIWDNIYIFVTFGVVLVGLTLAINKVLNNRLNRKYQEARDKIEELMQENKTLMVFLKLKIFYIDNLPLRILWRQLNNLEIIWQ